MPAWHYREYHSIPLDAPTDVVMAAAQQATWQDAPIARFWLLFTRNKLSGDRRILDDMAAGGETILDLTENEFVYGGIGSNEGPIKHDRPMSELFLEFDEAGWKKVGFNIRFADGALSTETRIFATDPATRKRFGRYWAVIRIPSGMIRMAMLRGIRERVQAKTK